MLKRASKKLLYSEAKISLLFSFIRRFFSFESKNLIYQENFQNSIRGISFANSGELRKESIRTFRLLLYNTIYLIFFWKFFQNIIFFRWSITYPNSTCLFLFYPFFSSGKYDGTFCRTSMNFLIKAIYCISIPMFPSTFIAP